jgi:UDP-GlcNAc:undecaprenyl-phosphate GlcNAc-1-phosphate transferase
VQPGFVDYLIIGAIAAVVTFLVTPIVGAVSRRRGWVAEPNDRSVHTIPIAHAGGLAMLIGLVV